MRDKIKLREYHRKYYLRNKDRIKKRQQEYRIKNRAKILRITLKGGETENANNKRISK